MKNLAFLFLAVAFAAFAANGCQLRPSHIVVKDAEKENESDDYPAWKKPELAVTKLSIVPAKVNPGDYDSEIFKQINRSSGPDN